MFWITGSFPFDIDETSGSISVGTPFDAYQRTMQLLNDANVSLYPVDARGVVVVGEMDATMNVSREMMRAVPEYVAGESRSHQKTVDTMRVFADTTGGKAYYNNDLAGALSDATGDGSSYYILSYALDTKNNHPGWRKLKVKVRDHDYRIRSRGGFFVTQTTMDPSSSEAMDIREALTSPLDYTGMPLSVKLDAPVTSGVKRKVGFSLLVPANAATVDASDNDRLNLEIWYVAFCEDPANWQSKRPGRSRDYISAPSGWHRSDPLFVPFRTLLLDAVKAFSPRPFRSVQSVPRTAPRTHRNRRVQPSSRAS